MLPTTRSNRSPTPLSTTRRHSPFVHSNSRRHPPLRHHHSRTSTISTPQPPPSTPPPPQPNHLNTINNITSSPPTTVAAIITHQHHPHCYAVLTTTTIMIRVRFILIVTPMVCLAVISTERMRLDLDSAQGERLAVRERLVGLLQQLKRNESCDMCFNLDAELLKSQNAHNDLLKSSKDRPPMLAPGNYIQWKSRIKRYIDTKPNRELIHFCLTNPPYELGWKEKFVLDSEGNPTTATQQVFETYKNVTQDIRDQLNAEVEAVQIILTGIDNDIYSTVDAKINHVSRYSFNYDESYVLDYYIHIEPIIKNTIEQNFDPAISKINVGLNIFLKRLNEEMVADLRYFNSLESEVDSLTSQLETQKTQFVNEIDRLSREYYYADHMNAILGVYTELDKVTNLQSRQSISSSRVIPIPVSLRSTTLSNSTKVREMGAFAGSVIDELDIILAVRMCRIMINKLSGERGERICLSFGIAFTGEVPNHQPDVRFPVDSDQWREARAFAGPLKNFGQKGALGSLVIVNFKKGYCHHNRCFNNGQDMD
nr:hypothetical protein [Tanacetum cinerariifolium]